MYGVKFMKVLKEIYFGAADGKNEKNILENFFNYQNIYEQLENGRFLILGNKGTGKTFLLEYFKKRKEKEGNIFTSISLEKFFSDKKLLETRKELLDEKNLLKWIIYIELSKLILSPLDFIDKNNKLVKRLETFMKKNSFDLDLDTHRIIDTSLEQGIKGNLSGKKGLAFLIEKFKNIKTNIRPGAYYEYIDSLEKIIIKILNEYWKSENKIYIIFDELDNLPTTFKEIYPILRELLKLSDELNGKWKENSCIQILIGMRLDIYYNIDATFTNKLKEDKGIVLDWTTQEGIMSPLFKMLFHKIRSSNTELKDLSHKEVGKLLFPKQNFKLNKKEKMDIYKYILGKTLLRPRDIISFFLKAQHLYPDNISLSPEELQKISKDFSGTLFMEIQNQASGSLGLDIFKEFLTLLKKMKKNIFYFTDLQRTLKKSKNICQYISKENIELILEEAFKIGIIGNLKETNNHVVGAYFKYKNGNEMDLEEQLIVHYGIRYHLNLDSEINLEESIEDTSEKGEV